MEGQARPDLTLFFELPDQPENQCAEAVAGVSRACPVGDDGYRAPCFCRFVEDRAQVPVCRQPHRIARLALSPIERRSVIAGPREADDVALTKRGIHAERYRDLYAAGSSGKYGGALVRRPCPVRL